MQLSFMKGHVRMARFTTLPTQALAIGLFAITGFAAALAMAKSASQVVFVGGLQVSKHHLTLALTLAVTLTLALTLLAGL